MIDQLLCKQNLILVPAYGRDYKTEEELHKAFWEDEKDFKFAGTSTYCSIRDFSNEYLTIRYDGLSKTTSIFAGKY